MMNLKLKPKPKPKPKLNLETLGLIIALSSLVVGVLQLVLQR